MSTPDFRILANNEDITAKIQPRLLSLKVMDEAGFKSDALNISLDDKDHQLALPAVGASLDIALGYKNELVQLGAYIVDSVQLSSPPAKMTINAKAANFSPDNALGSLQTQETRSWLSDSLAAMVRTIAANHGYQAVVAEAFDDIQLPHVDQTAESDINLLVRLADENGAVIKLMDERLCCVKKNEAEASNGEAMPTVFLGPSDVTSWNISFTNKSKFKAVETRWHDRALAQTLSVQTSEETPLYQATQTFANEIAARTAAAALLKKFSRSNSKLGLNLPGNMKLSAERRIELRGFREGTNGVWVCESVSHEYSSSGFTTRVSAVLL